MRLFSFMRLYATIIRYMNDAQNENKQKNTDIDLFLLTAHDISTSLTATRWAIETLQDGDRGPLTKEQQEILSEVQRQNKQSIDTIHTMMKSIKDGAAHESSISKVSIEEILKDAIESTRIEASRHGVTFNYNSNSNIPLIDADKQALLIVFRALLKNAVQYGSEGTPIIITVQEKESTVSIDVKNEGLGISEEEKPHIFQRFFRGEETEKKEGGFGVGLYGAKKIITEHNGDISFISDKGHGATFTVTLPIAKVSK